MSLHLPHAALTLALTASSDPPSLMVTPTFFFTFIIIVIYWQTCEALIFHSANTQNSFQMIVI